MNGTSVYLADEVRMCSRGALWSYARDSALLSPWLLWAGLSAHLLDPQKGLYFLLLVNCWLLQWIGLLALRDVVVQAPPAHPECTAVRFGGGDEGARFGGVCVEAGLLSSFYVLCGLHHFAVKLRPASWLAGVLWTAFVWFSLVYNGVYSNAEFAWGLLAGAVLATVTSYVFVVVALPRLSLLSDWWPLMRYSAPDTPVRREVWRIF